MFDISKSNYTFTFKFIVLEWPLMVGIQLLYFDKKILTYVTKIADSISLNPVNGSFSYLNYG